MMLAASSKDPVGVGIGMGAGNSPIFIAELLAGLIASRYNGDIVPPSPADTTRWCWVHDEAAAGGLWKEIPAYGVRSYGARAIENCLVSTQHINDSVHWTYGGGGHNATEGQGDLLSTNSGNIYVYQGVGQGAKLVEDGHIYAFRGKFKVYPGDGDANVGVRLQQENGTTQWASSPYKSIPDDGKWHDLTITLEALNRTPSTTVSAFIVRTQTHSRIYGKNFQFEDVTEQTNKNPSEYVPSGAGQGPELNSGGSAPAETESDTILPWVAGGSNTFVEEFATDDSDYALCCESNTSPTSTARMYIDLSQFGFRDNEPFAISFRWRHVGTGGIWQIGLNSSNTSVGTTIVQTASSTSNFYRDAHWEGVYSSSVRYLIALEINASNDGGIYIDNLSIKRDAQNSNLSSLRWSTFKNGNTVSGDRVVEATGDPIDADHLKGYFAEPARTQLLTTPGTDEVGVAVTAQAYTIQVIGDTATLTSAVVTGSPVALSDGVPYTFTPTGVGTVAIAYGASGSTDLATLETGTVAGSPIPDGGATVGADHELAFDANNLPTEIGSIEFEFALQRLDNSANDISLIAANSDINDNAFWAFDASAGTDRVYLRAKGNGGTAADGPYIENYVPGTVVKAKVRWNSSSGELQCATDASAGSKQTDFPGFSVGANLELAWSASRGVTLKNIRIYNRDLGEAWLETA